MIAITLNGQPTQIPAGLTLRQALEHLQLGPERLAVELNQTVIRRADWGTYLLAEGDRLEVVHFVGGG